VQLGWSCNLGGRATWVVVVVATEKKLDRRHRKRNMEKLVDI
jgi:hypothetical protein